MWLLAYDTIVHLGLFLLLQKNYNNPITLLIVRIIDWLLDYQSNPKWQPVAKTNKQTKKL